MLKLQDIEIISRKIDRSEILIAKFINGYASGWEFAVRKEFITPPTNKLNYAIITYGKNRWKKTNTKRVVRVKKDSNKAKK